MKSEEGHEKPRVLRPKEGVKDGYTKTFWKMGYKVKASFTEM